MLRQRVYLMSNIVKEMNTYMKMVSDNMIKEKSYQSVHDILQAHPKEVALFKRSPEDFDLSDHPEFYQDLFDLYSNSGDMPYGTMKARDGDPYEWIQDQLMDEILGKDDDFDPHSSSDYDDDTGVEYQDDNDWGGYDSFESKVSKDLDEPATN